MSRASVDRAALWGGCVFIGFGLAAAAVCLTRDGCAAYASEVPPLIRPVLRPARPAAPPAPLPVPAAHADTYVPRAFSIDEGDSLASEAERIEVERVLASCSRGRTRATDPFDVLDLLRLEDALGVPRPGLLVAIWCVESALRTEAPLGGPIRGDWLDGHARARGPYQGHGWLWAWCGLDVAGADDLTTAASCYWARVVDRQARVSDCADSWRVAEALTANGPRYLPAGCSARSGHWRELESWGAP